MLKRLVNEARFHLLVEATGPLLVKSGHASITGPDATPVRVHREGQWQVYIPGSSLKGVLRSHIERIGRTINTSSGTVCNPFLQVRDTGHGRGDYADASCGSKLEDRERADEQPLSTEAVYADSCPACRLFGSTSFIGRASIGDAYLLDPASVRTEQRDGVGIDRLTGGAANRAKFDLEAVSPGARFLAPVLLRNFECWQLGALCLAAQDLEDELIHVGSGRSRGLGQVRGGFYQPTAADAVGGPFQINHVMPDGQKPSREIWGLGKFLDDGSYGTRRDDLLTLSFELPVEERGIRLHTTLVGDQLTELSLFAGRDFSDRLRTWQPPETMLRAPRAGARAGGR